MFEMEDGSGRTVRAIYDVPVRVRLDCRVKNPKTGALEYQTRTKQADAQACDINFIMKRFENTGYLPEMIRADARYGDFSAVPTYQEALEVCARAEEQFMALSAKVRDRFDNDPAKMLAFCADPKNKDEMVALGLAVAKAPPAPVQPNATEGGSGASQNAPAAGG